MTATIIHLFTQHYTNFKHTTKSLTYRVLNNRCSYVQKYPQKQQRRVHANNCAKINNNRISECDIFGPEMLAATETALR